MINPKIPAISTKFSKVKDFSNSSTLLSFQHFIFVLAVNCPSAAASPE
nr:MAG TPA: hypothetical protein [Caudoviricetes sp.]